MNAPKRASKTPWRVTALSFGILAGVSMLISFFGDAILWVLIALLLVTLESIVLWWRLT